MPVVLVPRVEAGKEEAAPGAGDLAEHAGADPQAQEQRRPGPRAGDAVLPEVIFEYMTNPVWGLGMSEVDIDIPSFVATSLFVPSLLIMSAVKFFIVVAFYMHLKYDHKLFRVLFIGPLIIAIVTLIVLMLLFGQL